MKILIVEDDSRHMESAVEIIKATGHEAVSVANAREAVGYLRGCGIDGVITDLFIPDGVIGASTNADQPRGLAVLLEAKHFGIPCIICTAGYHHGSKYNWINWLVSDLGWPDMIDSPLDEEENIDTESASKDWQGALDALIFLIGRKV